MGGDICHPSNAVHCAAGGYDWRRIAEPERLMEFEVKRVEINPLVIRQCLRQAIDDFGADICVPRDWLPVEATQKNWLS